MSYLPSGSRFILLLFACVPTRPQFAKLHMLASINEEPYANLHRGYPMDALGRLFFSFSISEIKAGSWHEPYECGLNKDSWKWGSEACRRAYMSAVGTYIKYQDVPVDIYRRDENDAFSRYDRLQLRRTHVRLPLYNSEDLKGTPSSYWYKKNAFRLPGILSGQRVRGILEIMHKCGERIGRRNYPGGFLEIGCGFGEFLEIMYREGKTSMEHVIAPDSSLEALSAMFWFYFCKVAWPEAVKWNGSRALMYTHPVCPNPCAYLTNPCTRIDNVIRLSPSIVMDPDAAERKIYIESLKICQPTETGVYDHNYRCVCQNGYEWSSVTMRCLLIDGCKDPKTGQPMCSRKGTQRCISMSANLAREDLDVPTVALSLPYACICYPGYMGYRCESPRDACIEHSSKTAMPGNQACRTYLGNTCVPRIGTDLYSCTCNKDWEHDTNADFPNCFKRKSVCDKIICRRGTCVASMDERTFICVCQMGWHGRFCDQPDIRTWLPWESWGRCSAEVCTGIGWRTRVRKCRVNVTEMADKGLCAGNDRDRQICKALCTNAMDAYIYLVKTLLLMAAVCAVLMTALCVLYLRVRIEQQ